MYQELQGKCKGGSPVQQEPGIAWWTCFFSSRYRAQDLTRVRRRRNTIDRVASILLGEPGIAWWKVLLGIQNTIDRDCDKKYLRVLSTQNNTISKECNNHYAVNILKILEIYSVVWSKHYYSFQQFGIVILEGILKRQNIFKNPKYITYFYIYFRLVAFRRSRKAPIYIKFLYIFSKYI